MDSFPSSAAPASGPTGAALFALGFRPFYLLAAAFGTSAIPAWVASYTQFIRAPTLDLHWHVYEMVFGFCMAVVAGFLLTAALAIGAAWCALHRRVLLGDESA